MMKVLKLIHIILTIIFPRKLPKMEKIAKPTPFCPPPTDKSNNFYVKYI